MNITISVDCTAAEAREILGLPDIKDMQSEIVSEMQKNMINGVKDMDSADLFKLWMPVGAPGLEQFQKLFENLGIPGTIKR